MQPGQGPRDPGTAGAGVSLAQAGGGGLQRESCRFLSLSLVSSGAGAHTGGLAQGMRAL